LRPLKLDNYCTYGYTRKKASEVGQRGTFYYIGKGKRRRVRSVQHSVPVPQEKDRSVILLEGISEEYAFELEALLISLLGRVDLGTGTLRNRTSGGEGASGYKHTEQAKLRISQRLSNPSPGTRARRSAAQIGRVQSPECRAKISAKNTGNKFTEAMRARMAAAHLGGKRSEATRSKMSAARKLWWAARKKTTTF
jgi:NUMOD3 motif-containing protein